MAFVPFIDDLGFVVALILAGAALLTFTSIRAFWHILRNDPTRVRASIKASAVPAGIIGMVALAIGLFTEFTWPYLVADGLGSYNIFFGDVICLFGMVMLVYAFVGYFGLKLEYAGFFGFVSGVITAWYGYWGYTTLTASGTFGLTKDPLETLLLYGAYAAAGVFALPAALVVDWWLEHPGSTFPKLSLNMRPISEEAGENRAAEEGSGKPRYRVPAWVYLVTVWFPIFMFLAALAAWFYIGDILPGHLTSPP
jgi:putative membrane protein